MFLSLKGQYIASNSYVDVDDIGEGDNALLCHTNKTACCGEVPNRAGEWYFPDGTQVRVEGASPDGFYRDRGAQVVRLNRRYGLFIAEGVFWCEIPDANNNWQAVFINIGM